MCPNDACRHYIVHIDEELHCWKVFMIKSRMNGLVLGDSGGWNAADVFDVGTGYLRHAEGIERLMGTVNAIHYWALGSLVKALQAGGEVEPGTSSATEEEAAWRQDTGKYCGLKGVMEVHVLRSDCFRSRRTLLWYR